MVIKGGARGGAGGLAAHLLNMETNERAQMIEARGVVADDLEGALREMEAVASGSRSKRHFYHASINTDPTERLTPEQQAVAINRLEDKLGLTGQPRAVVEHEKEGRAHVHIVWSRIDLDRMRAISDSHNYRKHEEVARSLEQEFGHKRVQGAHIGRDGQERPERTPSHAEMQQADRTGLTPKEAKAQITGLWQQTDSGKAFAAALEQEGWLLARGDKRDFVVVDPHGEAHSLARRIEGAKAKDVRERMADMDAASVLTVDQARDQQHARQLARDEQRNAAAPAQPVPDMQPAPPLPLPVAANAAPPEPPQTQAAATPEPELIPAATVAATLVLEPDLPRGIAASGGDIAAEKSTAPLPLAAAPSDLMAGDGADGMRAADQDHRADPITPDADASTFLDTSPLAMPSAADLAQGLAGGLAGTLNTGLKLAGGVIGVLDGMIGGGSGKPTPAAAAPNARALTAAERHKARLQAFLEGDQNQRAERQEKAHQLGARDGASHDELRWEKETQEKRSQDRGRSR